MVYIDDTKKAFKMAMDILRQVDIRQYHNEKEPVSFYLTGEIEKDEDK